jgi:hypothetical protein
VNAIAALPHRARDGPYFELRGSGSNSRYSNFLGSRPLAPLACLEKFKKDHYPSGRFDLRYTRDYAPESE